MSRARLTTPRTLAAFVTVLVLAGAVAAVLAVLAGTGSPARPAHALAVRPAAVTAPPPVQEAAAPASPGPLPAIIATVSADTPYSAAPGGPAVGTVAARNPYGAPDVLAVIGSDGQGDPGWLHVRLPIRPNGSSGWIPSSGASLTQTDYRVAVGLASRTLTVTQAGQVVLTTPVAVGKASTPTPPGETYLWELIRPDDPNGAYGPYVFGLAEYSDAYSVFNGGDAQIGIHGQDEPWSIGHAVSNGCVRVPNDAISKLAGMLPLGTPVTIS